MARSIRAESESAIVTVTSAVIPGVTVPSSGTRTIVRPPGGRTTGGSGETPETTTLYDISLPTTMTVRLETG